MLSLCLTCAVILNPAAFVIRFPVCEMLQPSAGKKCQKKIVCYDGNIYTPSPSFKHDFIRKIKMDKRYIQHRLGHGQTE